VILPDVNVLIYAFREGAPQYALCNSWLTGVIAGDANFGLSRLALGALVRVTTNSRSFDEPSSLVEAFSFCDYLLSQPNCQVIEPGERHWEIFRRICRQTNTTGPRVTDAWFAALAIEWDCEWITFDRDYAMFPGLKWRKPSA
jgi:toxin-antitoxin system PIN domain toxin